MQPENGTIQNMENFENTDEETSDKTTEKATAKTTAQNAFRKMFSAKRLALMAIFVAFSYVASLWEIPIFPAAPVLKLDFGNVFIMLIGFLLGPVEGMMVCILKELLRIPLSSSGGVGELANMFFTASYILLPSIAYHYKKNFKCVIITLCCACFIETAAALLLNKFVMYPFYGQLFHIDGAAMFHDTFWLIVAFNFIKTGAIGLLTTLLYKRLSRFLKKLKI